MIRKPGIHLVLALALLLAVCPAAGLHAQVVGDEALPASEPIAAEPAEPADGPVGDVLAAPEPVTSNPDVGGSGIDSAGNTDPTGTDDGASGITSDPDYGQDETGSTEATLYPTVSAAGGWAAEDPDSIDPTSYSTVSGPGGWSGEGLDSASDTSYSTLSGDSSNWTTVGAAAAPAPAIEPITREQALEALRRAGRRSADGGLTPDEIRDGCYARALDTSDVLREMGIESETAFIVAGRNGPLSVKDKDGNTVQWGWHVTPTVMVRGDDGTVQRVALDPAMSGPDATETMSMDQWVGRMIGDKTPYDTLLQGRDYAADERTPITQVAKNPYVTYSSDGRVFPPYHARDAGDANEARIAANGHYRDVFPDVGGKPNPARYRWGSYNGNNVRLAAAPADESDPAGPAETVPPSELTTVQPMAVD